MSDKRPYLDELLADPMVQLVIRSSHSAPEEVRMLMLEAGTRGEILDLPPAHVIAAQAKGSGCCAG